jgi:hypothetical protein
MDAPEGKLRAAQLLLEAAGLGADNPELISRMLTRADVRRVVYEDAVSRLELAFHTLEGDL